MSSLTCLAAFPITALVAPLAAQEPELPGAAAAEAAITESFIMAHTRFLSDDLLAGRGPGTAGDRLAQGYLIAQFEALGLEPAAADGSWLQPFELISITADPAETLSLSSPGGETLALDYSEDWIATSGEQAPRTALDGAEVVFVGYGIEAPEVEWNDYKDADVAGKVLLFLNSDPAAGDPAGDRFAGDTRLYYGRWTYKYETAAEKGAAGAFIIHTTPSAGYPWQVVTSSWSGAQFELPRPADEPRVEVEGWFTEDAARRVVELAGRDLDELVAAAQQADFRPVPLGVTVDVAFTSAIDTTGTANVLARLPGADPARAGEHVLYTAHFDHLGVGAAADGDSIYNGARDNALGTVSMLAIARSFAALPEPPARSVLFAAVGAEEQGLLGSQYLAQHPPVPACDLVANINLDGGNIWGRTTDVRQVGRGKSTLDEWLDRFAAAQDREVFPEEFPDKGYFYRSDQFSLAKIGVPALYLDEGIDFVGRPPGWGEEQVNAWLEEVYHQPSDEITPEWNLEGAAQDARLLFQVGYAVADSPERPAWLPGDEFAAVRAACPTE
ncbi:MAG TPA: M28 family peptidase [Gemmatimonadota bacterium]|nr:M28 family peptidase [Gemmatimonadota bacterium]